MIEAGTEETTAPGVEAPLRVLAEGLPQLVFSARADGSWEYVNGRWEALTGARRESAVGFGWRDFVHPDDLAAWKAIGSVTHGAERSASFEARLRSGTGEHQQLRVRVERARSDGRDVCIGTATLVEPSVATVVGPVASRIGGELARRALEGLFTFVAVLDLDGTILDLNGAPLDATGIPRSAVLGERFWHPWGPRAAESVRRVQDACRQAATGELVRYDEVVPRPDGTLGTIDIQIAPLLDDVGHPTHLVASAVDITERKRVEAALRESEERAQRAARDMDADRRLLDAVLEAAPVGIVVTDAHGHIVRMNRENERLWGIDRASMRVDEHAEWKGWWADGSERDGRRVEGQEWAMAAALRGEFVPGDVVEIEPFDAPGVRRTIINSGAPVLDASGRVVGGVVVQKDITGRVEAEAAVRRSEERYRLVARATNDVVWDWDLVNGRLDWNETVLEHFGCTREELGHAIEGWTDRIHPDDLERVSRDIQAALDGTAASWSDEYRFRKNDGSYGVFFDRGYIARDEAGRAVRMIGSMLDVTEQRRTEAALRESEERFRALADNMSPLAWIADAGGNLVWSNKRWIEYTGLTPDEMSGQDWGRIMHPDHVERVSRKFGQHLQSGERWEDTFPALGADGRYRWFLSRAIPIHDESGHVVRWFGTNTDVTEQREAEQALREADRRKDEFLAMLAHELRNPLAPVRNAVHVLRKVGPPDPTLDRLRDVIDRQVTHMARLIDDLLDVSRIARGRIQLRRERHDLAQIVRQTAEDYRTNLESSGLVLDLDVEDAPLWVDGDGTRLAQIVGNLLHNAGKFTERGGRIHVRVGRSDPGWASICVEDTGIGIEPAMLERLFDPFSQAAQGLDRSKGGLGLGLALAKALVELHGGTVTARSRGLGEGSSFLVRLPLAAPALSSAQPTLGVGTGLRIVVIEDNPDAAETLEMVLTLAGHEVKVALDGRTGIETVRAMHPDVLICDIGLPGGFDGYAVGRALRAEPAITPALMIALSGYSQDEDRRRSREAGFDAHVAKPADIEKLQSLLSEVHPHA